MAPHALQPPFDELERELIRTFLAGFHGVYPQSHSDCQHAMRAVLKRFDISPRAVPLDWADLFLKEK